MKILDTILGRKPAEQRFEEVQAERKDIEREIADKQDCFRGRCKAGDE